MAGKRYLEIIAELRDKVTQKVEQIERSFNRFDKQIQRTGSQWKKFGRDMEQVGNQMAVAGAALTGPLLLAFNNSAQYSARVSDQLERLKNITTQVQVTIGEALAPIIERLANILGALLARWNTLDPVLRQNIIQATFMTGVFLTMSGVLLSITGRVIKFAGEVLKLAGIFLRFAAVHPVLMVIVSAIVLMIVYWDKLKAVAVPALNAIEVAANMVAIGYQKMVAFWVDGTIRMALSVADLYRQIARIPGPQQKIYLTAAAGFDNLAAKLRIYSTSTHQAINDLEQNMARILANGKGALVGMTQSADGFLNKIRELYGVIANPPPVNIEPVVKQFDALKTITEGIAQTMSRSFGDILFNVITGKVKDLKGVFADFGKQILQILSQALAKLILIKTIGRAFPGLGQFFHQGGMIMHAGGMIRRAHSGMLANDEVPIIAQTGEAVLSRRGVSTLGVDNVYRLNRGQSPSSGGTQVTIQVNPVISLVHPSDFMRHRKEISAALAEDLKNNATIRQVIRSYG